MPEMALVERSIFISVLVLYFASSVVGAIQLFRDRTGIRRLLISLIALAVSLESVILVFRAVEIKAIPLTDSFESMIVLTLVFGLTYLFLSTMIRQVWFNSIMVWSITVIAFLTLMVADSASPLLSEAKRPWIMAHGISMVLAGAMIAFAAAMAILFLFARRKLKSKELAKVIGKVPNIERIVHMNLFGLKGCFVFLTFGLVSGIGMAMTVSAAMDLSLADWLFDAKIVLVGVAWVLVGLTWLLCSVISVKGKTTAYITLAAFSLIIFAIVGTTIFCGTTHSFSITDTNNVNVKER